MATEEQIETLRSMVRDVASIAGYRTDDTSEFWSTTTLSVSWTRWHDEDGNDMVTFQVPIYLAEYPGLTRRLLEQSMRIIRGMGTPDNWYEDTYRLMDSMGFPEAARPMFMEHNGLAPYGGDGLRRAPTSRAFVTEDALKDALVTVGVWNREELDRVSFVWDPHIAATSDGKRSLRLAILPARYAGCENTILDHADRAARKALGRMPRMNPLAFEKLTGGQ